MTIDPVHMGGYHIAVVGATGAAGTELLRVLERRSFPVATLRPIGSARSVGKPVRFSGDSIPVEKLDAGSFEKIDIAFFSAGGDVSRTFVPIACQADAIAIDKSSAFRMDPKVPLVIPEINAGDVKLHRGVIANPNCTTTVMLMSSVVVRSALRLACHLCRLASDSCGSGIATAGEKVNVPIHIDPNIARFKGNQTTRPNKHDIHRKSLEHFDQVRPVDAGLFQPIRPELE